MLGRTISTSPVNISPTMVHLLIFELSVLVKTWHQISSTGVTRAAFTHSHHTLDFRRWFAAQQNLKCKKLLYVLNWIKIVPPCCLLTSVKSREQKHATVLSLALCFLFIIFHVLMIKKTGFQRLRQQNLTHSDSYISFLLVSELLTDSLRSCDRHFTSFPGKLSINLRVQRLINAMNSFSVCVTCFVVGPDLENMPKEKKDGNFGKDKNKTINPSYMHVIIAKKSVFTAELYRNIFKELWQRNIHLLCRTLDADLKHVLTCRL